MNSGNLFLAIIIFVGIALIVFPNKLAPLFTYESWITQKKIRPWFIRAIGITFVALAMSFKI